MTDTTHSKMGSQYQEVYNTHGNIHSRYTSLEDGFSILRSIQHKHTHTILYTYMADTTHSKMGCQYQEVHNTHGNIMTDTTHSKMGSQYQEVYNTHGNIHGRYTSLEDGFSILRSIQHKHTHTILYTYMADTTHSKMGCQYQEVHNTHGNIHGRYSCLTSTAVTPLLQHWGLCITLHFVHCPRFVLVEKTRLLQMKQDL